MGLGKESVGRRWGRRPLKYGSVRKSRRGSDQSDRPSLPIVLVQRGARQQVGRRQPTNHQFVPWQSRSLPLAPCCLLPSELRVTSANLGVIGVNLATAGLQELCAALCTISYSCSMCRVPCSPLGGLGITYTPGFAYIFHFQLWSS